MFTTTTTRFVGPIGGTVCCCVGLAVVLMAESIVGFGNVTVITCGCINCREEGKKSALLGFTQAGDTFKIFSTLSTSKTTGVSRVCFVKSSAATMPPSTAVSNCGNTCVFYTFQHIPTNMPDFWLRFNNMPVSLSVSSSSSFSILFLSFSAVVSNTADRCSQDNNRLSSTQCVSVSHTNR
ncbi:hypothetical protein FF38_01611 [Lucilia cuprina]|uniref:Uncharacterized protein n=1 Tax=Lucilia cuprina TaxID=7375 RepID=A0A0L0CF65_LUCCU|nr:hypothetical protein FF38_01611 [Lucilia cuprina]